MSEPSVGSVSVDVVPDARNFARRVAQQVNPEAAKIGQQFGELFGAGAERKIADGVKDGLKNGTSQIPRDAPKQGAEYGGLFSRALKARLEQAFKTLPEAKITADSSDADREIASIRAQLLALRDRKVGVDIDGADALAELDRINGRLERLATETTDVQIRTDAAAASATLARFQADVRRLDGSTATVDVDVDTAGASAQLALLRGQALTAQGGMLALVGTAVLLGPALIPIGAAGAGAMGAIAAGAIAAASGVGVLLLALAPVIGAVQAVRAAEDQSAQSARGSTSAHLQMASAMDAVRSAKDNLRSATLDAEVAQVRADRAVEDAERSLADAQRDSLDAIRDLNEARRQAARDAEDLASRVANGALDEREAVLRIAEARRRVAEAQADPKASQAERDAAQLSLDRALQGLRDQQTENRRLADEKKKADEQGVEGSDRVRKAHENVADAHRRVQDTQRGVTEAVEAGADSQRRSAETIAAAQQAVVAAQRGVQQASQAAGATGGAAMDKVREKMEALAPAGVAFVTFITDRLLPAFNGLARTAQAGFLPGLQTALEALLPAVPALTKFVGGLAQVMGDLFVEAAKALGSPFWRGFFDYVGKTAGPILQQMGRTFGNVLTGIAGLIQAFAPLTEQFGGGILRLSQRFAEFGKNAGKSEGFQSFLRYVQENGPKVITFIGSLVAAFANITRALAPVGAIALSALTHVLNFIAGLDPVIIRGIALAFAAVAIAVGVTNAALALMALNPVVLWVAAIVAAVVALGVVLYEVYQRSETFRAIVDASWAAISQTVTTYWNTVIKPVFAALWTFITEVLAPVFVWLWQNVIIPVWHGIQTVITFAWNNIIKPILSAIGLFIREVLAPVFTWLWHNVISPVWTGIKIAIQIAWVAIQIILKTLEIFIRAVLAPVFTWLWHNVIQPVWNGISTTIAYVWTNGIKPVFQALGNFIKDHVAPAFTKGVEAIGKAWDKIKEVAKIPIRFVVNTVINKGIIDTFNKVAGFFKVDPIDHVQLPEGFARGGYISGPGGPREDLIPAMLSDGEFVVNAGAVKRLGVDFLRLINQADQYDISGDIAGMVARRNRFAGGGLVDSIKRWLPSVDPLPYIWGGVGPGGYDCSGLAGEVWARITGHPSFRRYFTTDSNFAGSGFARGPGMFSVGVDPGQHMAGNLAGLGFEAASTASGIHVGGSARSVGSFPQVWHLASMPGGGNAPPGFSWSNPFGSIRGLFSGITDQLKPITDSPFGRLVAGVPNKIVDAAVGFLSNIVPEFASGGYVTKYDSGGYLPPGLSTVLNGTGRPEPVLTAGQLDRLSSGKTLNVGPIYVTNPSPEATSESTTRIMRRAALLPFG